MHPPSDVAHVRLDEGLQTFRTKVEQLLAILMFLLLRETVLRLRDLELAIALQTDETYAEVCATYERRISSTE